MTIPLIQRAQTHHVRTAIVANEESYTYRQLLDASERVAHFLLDGQNDLNEQRIAFLVPPGFDYVAIQWGIWRAGGICVPLALSHPTPELEYVIGDAATSAIIASSHHIDGVQPIAKSHDVRLLNCEDAMAIRSVTLPNIDPDRRAMILYTSGTTGKPKGVVTTHRTIQAQVESLIEAWEWTADDHILNVLPLHHIHGIVNVLTCALRSGAKCEFMPRFDADNVWRCFGRGDLTLFMAVPTVYAKLIDAWQTAAPGEQTRMTDGCRSMRLMVSGSAALPVSMLETWQAITGHVLLERYGMTEIGMALSNSYRGDRIAGSVGRPLPNVHARRVDNDGRLAADGEPSEIQVHGPSVFHEYWQRPDATAESFVEGWFRTGDIAVVNDGVYKILGRSSVDIIKTGGYKVSALEIEEVLREHDAIRECAVVGSEDPTWGECVSACIVLDGETTLTLADLRKWARERLATYKIPRQILIATDLPRNAMGKVQKPEITKMFAAGDDCAIQKLDGH